TLDSLSALGPLSGLLIAAADALGLGANLDAIFGAQAGRVEVRVRVASVAPGLKGQVRTSLRAGVVGVVDELTGLNLLSDVDIGANVIVALALAVRVRDQDAVAGATRSPCGSLVPALGPLDDLADLTAECRIDRRADSARDGGRNVAAVVRGATKTGNVPTRIPGGRVPPLHGGDHL